MMFGNRFGGWSGQPLPEGWVEVSGHDTGILPGGQTIHYTTCPCAQARKRPTNTDFIQWLYERDFGETLTAERLERAYDEYKREIR